MSLCQTHSEQVRSVHNIFLHFHPLYLMKSLFHLIFKTKQTANNQKLKKIELNQTSDWFMIQYMYKHLNSSFVHEWQFRLFVHFPVNNFWHFKLVKLYSFWFSYKMPEATLFWLFTPILGRCIFNTS